MIKRGHLLCLLRKSLGMKQEDVARKLDISTNYLSLIENGKKQPAEGMIQRLAELYRVPAFLFYWDEDAIKPKTAVEKSLYAELEEVMKKLFYFVMNK